MAAACELLISEGHADPFSYTPKRLLGFSKLTARRRTRQAVFDLNIIRVASQGDKKAVSKFVKELLKSGKV